MSTAKKSDQYEKYDIFISYRRKGGWHSANQLAEKLKGKGYRVFIDLAGLSNGDFSENLKTVIENCKDFIIVLSPGALDACSDEKDWVRQELEHALNNDKNVVPYFVDEFQFPDNLPEEIEKVRLRNAVKENKDYFRASMKKLIDFLDSKPVWWRRPPLIAAVICAAVLCVFAFNRWGKPSLHEPPSPAESERTLGTEKQIDTAATREEGGAVTEKDQSIAFPAEDSETIASSGQKAVSCLITRTDEECPLTVYDPEGTQEDENERLYDNAMAAAALIAYRTGNKNHNESELLKILDSISETVGNGPSTETVEGVKGIAAASIVLLQYDHIQKNFSYARTAQAALDRVLEECADDDGGFRTGPGSESRSTSDNIWLYAAFDMLYEKTRNDIYREASRSAEAFAESMRSSDGKYFLAGDFLDDQRDRTAVSVETQALAALVMNDRSGIGKAMELRRNDGSFPTDESSADMMNTESTALMAAALKAAGQEDERMVALSAIYRYQKSSGGIPESDREGIADSSGKKLSSAARTSSTAWYAVACMEYDLFKY